MIVSKARAFPSGASFLSANIGLGWKGLPGKTTQPDYKHSYNTEVQSFITLVPGQIFVRIS
jgi:hypothetical protein